VESGLNDGICVPVLFVFLALALGHAGESGPWTLAVKLVAEEIGGGLLFGMLAKDLREEFLLAAEGTGDTLALITWVIFGSAVVGQALGNFTWLILLYSALSLTIIRMLPVYLSLAGSDIDTEGKLFIGWFGPRGLASIVFAVIVVNSDLPNTGPIAMTVVCTILLSIIGHGITATPWAKAYGERRLAQQDAYAGGSTGH
jgi:NhaP-type Na+/H+ or K+/H+ antiporter